eukprot:PITA_35482
MTLQPFEKWANDFVGPIEPQGKTGARYIITITEYLTRWAQAQPVKDCRATTAAKFLFENVLTRFGYPKILMSDRGMHFLNETINALTEEFQIYHQQSTPYHPQANGTLEAFNTILETALTKFADRGNHRYGRPRGIGRKARTARRIGGGTLSGWIPSAGKLHMHWLGPNVIKEVTDGGTVQLAKLNGDPFPGRVNGSRLKLYTGGPTT